MTLITCREGREPLNFGNNYEKKKTEKSARISSGILGCFLLHSCISDFLSLHILSPGFMHESFFHFTFWSSIILPQCPILFACININHPNTLVFLDHFDVLVPSYPIYPHAWVLLTPTLFMSSGQSTLVTREKTHFTSSSNLPRLLICRRSEANFRNSLTV